jgi:hypothetical protein
MSVPLMVKFAVTARPMSVALKGIWYDCLPSVQVTLPSCTSTDQLINQ